MGEVVKLQPKEDSPTATINAMTARIALVRNAVKDKPTSLDHLDVTQKAFELEMGRIHSDPKVRAKWARISEILGTSGLRD